MVIVEFSQKYNTIDQSLWRKSHLLQQFKTSLDDSETERLIVDITSDKIRRLIREIS